MIILHDHYFSIQIHYSQTWCFGGGTDFTVEVGPSGGGSFFLSNILKTFFIIAIQPLTVSDKFTVITLSKKEAVSSQNLTFFTDSSDEKVAFSAHILGDKVISLALGQILAFDQVPTNLGNGYNKDSGSFTAPAAGTYSFSIYFMSDHTAPCRLGIYINGESKCTAFANTLSMSSCTVMQDLNMGDVVNVKVFHRNDNKLYGSVGTGYKHQSGFIGFLYKKA